jgi:hypothetical protein
VLLLLLDEDRLHHGLVRGLRSSNVDVVTVAEVGRRGASDEQQLEFAASVGRSIYTANLEDFARLNSQWIATGRHHAGIIVVARQRTDIGAQIRALTRLCQELDPTDMQDRLEFLRSWTVR